jgi:hypothetical protein
VLRLLLLVLLVLALAVLVLLVLLVLPGKRARVPAMPTATTTAGSYRYWHSTHLWVVLRIEQILARWIR